MFEQIKDFFRKRKIRRYSRAVPTNILPLSEISTVNVVIDVEEQEYDLLKEDIVASSIFILRGFFLCLVSCWESLCARFLRPGLPMLSGSYSSPVPSPSVQ